MTIGTHTANECPEEIKLTPVLMEIRSREHDIEEPITLVNADEVIQAVVSGGHPNSAKLLSDYTRIIREIMRLNPQMPLHQAKNEAIGELLEELYDIKWQVVDEYGFESVPI